MTAAPAAPATAAAPAAAPAVTAADTTAGRVHECLARLAGVVEDTLAAITAADGTQVGMPTAGAVIAA
ncbi:MAG TPA: hypothetical protein VK875_11265, partial [Euzebyales bacterium]|nr:hypothetical protein [Euzebyales bacterium]